MEFLKADPEFAEPALRAIAMVAHASERGLQRPQRSILEAVQRLVLETGMDLESLSPVTPEELASQVDDPAWARQLVRLMVVTSLADGPPSADQMSLLSSFEAALGVKEPAVGVIRHLANGQRLRFRVAFARRSHVRTYLRNSYRLLGGFFPVLKALLRFRGVIGEDPELAARFHSLEDLPGQTLGREFFEHCRNEGLAFAGEKGGFPIGALYHDFAHVLSGYDTSPEGELRNAAFQAGFCRGAEDFFTLLFAVIIHTAGVNLAPFPMPVLRGRIGQENLALEMLHGWQRGAAMKVDLGSNWDFWEYVDLPIELVRDRLGVPPLNPDLASA